MLPSRQKAVQRLEETPAEASFRKANNFGDIESTLDSLTSSLKQWSPSPSPSPPPPEGESSKLKDGLLGLKQRLTPGASQLLDNVGSYFGHSNPLAQPANPAKDSVWLFDNIAYRPIHTYPHPQQPWHAVFVAAFFSKSGGKDAGKLVAYIADKVGLHEMDIPDAEGEKRIAERVAPFLTPLRPGRFLSVAYEIPGPDPQYKVGPAGRAALTDEVIGPLYEHDDGHVGTVRAVDEELTPHGPMNTFFTGPEGWTVISDIDDTIKITMTPDPKGILTSTFVATPETTQGMPAFYSHIQSTLNSTFFYLSASPYNLYPFLRPFIRGNYPPGPILLRAASWIAPSGLLQMLTQGVQAYKVSQMDKIHEWIPRRKMVCVGDSTQSDPEAYAEIYSKYPGWVKHIFIRKPQGLENMQEKNSDKRFEEAFKDVPREVWTTFEEPSQLPSIIDQLRATG